MRDCGLSGFWGMGALCCASATTATETIKPSATNKIFFFDIFPGSFLLVTSASENKFESELKLSRRRHSLGNLPGRRIAAGCRKNACGRQRKVGVVRDIEYFRAELHAEFLRDARVLEQGSIDIYKLWTNQRVPSEISQCAGCLQRKAIGIVPLLDPSNMSLAAGDVVRPRDITDKGRLNPVLIVNGRPPFAVRIPVTCQPSMSRFP